MRQLDWLFETWLNLSRNIPLLTAFAMFDLVEGFYRYYIGDYTTCVCLLIFLLFMQYCIDYELNRRDSLT